MTTAKLLVRPTPKSIASYVQKNAAKLKEAGPHHHGPSETIREASYKGHRIVVRTTYEITVDDAPITGHMGVGNDGQVHYHPVPNMSFASAIDLVRQLIDVFPDDFSGSTPPGEPHGHPMPTTKARSMAKSPSRRRK